LTTKLIFDTVRVPYRKTPTTDIR